MDVEFGHDALRHGGTDAEEGLQRTFHEGRFGEAEAVDEYLDTSISMLGKHWHC